MFSELFINAAIILATISLGNQILINKEITPSSSLKLRLFFGFSSGILGIILMNYSITIMPSVIMDLRNIAIVLSASYCGFLSTIITGLMIGMARLFFKDFTFPSLMAAANIFFITVSCAVTSLIVPKKLVQWTLMTFYTLIFPTVTFILVINSRDLLIKTIIIYWISTIISSIMVYIYIQYIDLLRFSYQKYRQDSYKDHRTGLYNVRQFDKEINKISNSLTESSVISILFIDIDYFKKVNDVYGHKIGDKVLADLGKILLSSTSSTDIVSRNGGEEFSVIMTDCPQEKVPDVAERIRKAVQEHKFCFRDGKMINITVSIGAAIYPFDAKSIEELVEKADSALYEAKRAGRNKVVLS